MVVLLVFAAVVGVFGLWEYLESRSQRVTCAECGRKRRRGRVKVYDRAGGCAAICHRCANALGMEGGQRFDAAMRDVLIDLISKRK